MSTEFQSFNWMRGVSDDKVIPSLFRFALLRLCLHRSKDGRCDPSHDTVAAEIGVSRDTILRAATWGERRGWLLKKRGQYGISYTFIFPVDKLTPDVADQQQLRPKAQKRPDVARQQHLRTKTTIKTTSNPDVAGQPSRCCWPATQMGSERSEEGENAPAREGAHCPQGQADAALPLVVQGGAAASINEASAASSSMALATVDAAFETFWQVYPLKEGKPGAQRAFAKAEREGNSAADLVQAATVYAAKCAASGRPPMQATLWFYNGHYQDAQDGVVINNDGSVFVQTNKPKPMTGGQAGEAWIKRFGNGAFH